MVRSEKKLQAVKWMTEYLHSTLGKTLGIALDDAEIELPARGLRSGVLLVHPPGAEPFVLRCFTKPRKAGELLKLARFASGHSLPVPGIVFSDTSRGHVKRHGFAVVVEEFLEGEHLEAGQPTQSQLRSAGEALAGLHSVESKRWGSPLKLKRGSYFAAMIVDKFENRLQSIAKHDAEYTPEWRERVMTFVKGFKKGWDGGSPYALIHDKLNTGNVIFAEGGRVHFLDLESLQFGAPGKDLAAALYYFCGGETEEALFKESYFARLDSRRREHFERFERLYRAWHHLSRWASKSRAAYKAPAKGEEEPFLRFVPMARERWATWNWIEKG